MTFSGPKLGLVLAFLTSFILLSALTAKAATKASCPSVLLLDETWAQLPEVQPPMMCYATVIANILTHESGTRISALHVANVSERAEDDLGLDHKIRILRWGERYAFNRFHGFGKALSPSINANLNSKICKYSFFDQLHSEDIVTIFTKLEDDREKRETKLLPDMKELFDGEQKGFAEKLYALSLKKEVPLIDLAMDLSCEPVALSRKLIARHLNFSNSPASFGSDQIDAVIKSGHAVAIGYDFNFFNGAYSFDREHAQHASMIVGQEWNEKRSLCEYIVRFTDLKTCEYVKNGSGCENGIAHAPKSELIHVISDITWAE